MCRKILLPLLLLLMATPVCHATQYAYQVNFTDKNGTLGFSDSLSFLSIRAMARRDAHGIVLDSTDLPVTHAYVDSVLALTHGKLHEVSKWLNMCVILIGDSTQIHALDGIAFVGSVRLVGYYATALHRDARPMHRAGAANKTTSGSTDYGDTWPQTLMVDGNVLHDAGYKGQGMIIAVLDAGYLGADTHEGFDSLRNDGRIVDVHNFTLDTSYVYSYDDHGTSVLSTMAGYVPGTFIGSAPLASYALYVTEDDNSEQPIELLNLLCGAERADSLGADVITCSLGYDTFNNPADDFNFATDFTGVYTPAAKAANMATKKGMLFVASAGNEGGGSWNNILTPGDADSALTIGSVTNTGVNATTSGYGPNAAGRVKPDVCGLGQYAYTFTSGDGYALQDGTSFSTPQIAGWAACLWQSYPSALPARVRAAIIQCADHYTDPGPQIGYGIPNFGCSSTDIMWLAVAGPVANGADIVVVNPAANELNIMVTMPEAETVQFELSDVSGKVLARFSASFASGANPAYTQNVATLPAGMYLLRAAWSGGTIVKKVIRN